MENYIRLTNEFESVIDTLTDQINYPICFYEFDDCILLGAGDNGEEPHIFMNFNGSYEDRTGYEALMNHVHISDIIEFEIMNPLYELNVGLRLMKKWKNELSNRFPKFTFILILSYDGEGAVVRFHKCHPNEPLWMNIDDIEKFEEGIQVAEVKPNDARQYDIKSYFT